MGSSLSQQLCCALCERCREQEAANTEPSETKPILQSPADRRTFLDTQPSTPALKVPKQGSKELPQEQRASAGALEENGEPCSAPEGWEAAWNPMDFFVVPADEEDEGEAEGLRQQEEGGEAEEEVKAAAVGAEEEQAGREGAPCAGLALQEGNIPMELSREAGTEPPADTPGVLVGTDLSLCAVQVAGPELDDGTDGAEAAEPRPQAAQRAELSCLVEAMALLTLQSPSEVVARGVAELYCSSAVSWQPLCPQWGSLETPSRLLELLRDGMEGTALPAQAGGSLCCAGPGEILQQDGALCELGEEILQQDGALCELGGEILQQDGALCEMGGEILQDGALCELGEEILQQDGALCEMGGEILQQDGALCEMGGEILQQDGDLCELGGEGSRGCSPGAEAELQDGIVQPAVQLPEEPTAFVPAQREAELPLVPPSLPRVLGSCGEIEAEKVEA